MRTLKSWYFQILAVTGDLSTLKIETILLIAKSGLKEVIMKGKVRSDLSNTQEEFYIPSVGWERPVGVFIHDSL